jgi:urea transport system substrate-binding protein
MLPTLPIRTRRAAVAAAGAAVLAAGLAGCGNDSSPAAGGGAQTVSVGVVLQLSGTGSVYAEAAQAGIKAGVTDVNKRAVAGATISTEIADAGSDAQSATTTCSRLVQQKKVRALLVFIPGPQLIACNAIAKRTNTPVISLSSGAGNICAPNLVSLGLVPNQQTLPVIKELLDAGKKSFYFFGGDYSTPKATAAIATAYVSANGGTVAGQSFEPLGTSDFSQDINKIVAAHPDVAFLNTVGNDDVALQKQWAADPRTKGIERVDILLGEGPAKALGAAAAGIWSSNVYFSGVTGDGNTAFKSALTGAGLTGSADTNAYVSYMQVEVLAAALKQGGSDNAAVVAALQKSSVDGPVGTLAVHQAFSFQPIYLAQANADGTFTIRKQAPAIEPELSCKPS